MKNERRIVEPRNTRTMPAGQYKAALSNFLKALGIDEDTQFKVVVEPHQTVVNNVVYTRQDNGTMSGDFWLDVIERGGSE